MEARAEKRLKLSDDADLRAGLVIAIFSFVGSCSAIFTIAAAEAEANPQTILVGVIIALYSMLGFLIELFTSLWPPFLAVERPLVGVWHKSFGKRLTTLARLVPILATLLFTGRARVMASTGNLRFNMAKALGLAKAS